MKKGKILSINGLPKIIIKQQNNKVKNYELEGVFVPSINYIETNSYSHYYFKKYLFKNIQYQISKQTSKIKIYDQEGNNILFYLLQKRAIQINDEQITKSTLFTAKEKQILSQIKTTEVESDIINFIEEPLRIRQFIKDLKSGDYTLESLGNNIIISKDKFYLPIQLKYINHSFFAFNEEQFFEFLEKNRNIKIEMSKPVFDAVKNTYKIECVFPFQMQLKIIRQGWGTLSIKGELGYNQKQYDQISQAMTCAKNTFKGIWKNNMDIFNLIYVKNNFLGVVLEIIEGGLYKIKNLANNQIFTVELAKIVCPSHQQLGAYQCRQFARQQAIGREFNVYIQKDSGFNLMATLIRTEDYQHFDKIMIQNGWGLVKKELSSKKDTSIIRLLELQKKCMQNKIGLHSNKLGIFRFEDLTILNRKQMIKRAKEFVDRIFVNQQGVKQKKLTGIIEKFKQNDIFVVRLTSVNTLLNLKLQRVKSLITKLQIVEYKNFEAFSKNYLYENYLQREVQITIKYLQEGIEAFVGKIVINRKDIAQNLLKQGLVYHDKEQYDKKYQELEETAKLSEKGLWMPMLSKLIIQQQKLETCFKASISQIHFSGHYIYYQPTSSLKKLHEQINPYLTFEKCKNNKVTQSKTGNIYAAPYLGDLYRVRVLSNVKNNPTKCNVKYIDYGNEAQIDKYDLYAIPQSAMIIQDIAVQAKLFLLKPLFSENQMYEVILDEIRNQLLEKEFYIEKLQDNNILIYQDQIYQITKSINARFIEQGLLKTDNSDLNKLDIKIKNQILEFQKSAKIRKIGLWEADYSDEEQIDNY